MRKPTRNQFPVFLLLVFSTLAVSIANAQPRVLKGSLPTDSRYWEFNRWFKGNNTVASLVVAGEDREHLESALNDLKYLRDKKVLIGSVVVSGGPYASLLSGTVDYEQLAKKLKPSEVRTLPTELLKFYRDTAGATAIRDLATDLKLGAPSLIEADTVFDKLNISTSPAWVIRHDGKNYIFEGKVEIRRFFTGDGRFMPPSSDAIVP